MALDQRIRAIWDEVDADNPDKSTAWVGQMTADRAGVSYDRVFDALERTARTPNTQQEGR